LPHELSFLHILPQQHWLASVHDWKQLRLTGSQENGVQSEVPFS
jgi:hypothetical protein